MRFVHFGTKFQKLVYLVLCLYDKKISRYSVVSVWTVVVLEVIIAAVVLTTVVKVGLAVLTRAVSLV